MSKSNLIKKAGIAAVVGMLPLSQTAMAEASWGISGWINEGVTYADDGRQSAVYQTSENGHTLGSRVTLSGAADLANSGLSAGFELIIEPQSSSELLGAGSGCAPAGGTATGGNQTACTGGSLFGKESLGGPNGHLNRAGLSGNGHELNILGNSLYVSGAFGKVTIGLQSMPTDNIAVLEDPSLTLWSAISPVFVGNGTAIQVNGGTNGTWGAFLNCATGIGGIGIDCNGIYRKGVRYDLPSFGPVSIAVGMANNDVYDIMGKYKGSLGSVNTQIALGYSQHAGNNVGGTGVDIFQMQAGAMHPATGIFGSIAYQNQDLDGPLNANIQDSNDAWWIKAGIKKAWNSLGDTSFSVNYGQYSDQYTDTTLTGSEVDRLGFEVNQYFGSKLIIYGVYEQLDLSVDGAGAGAYAGAQELDTFRTGLTFFF